MRSTQSVPIFSLLNKVELAKLMPDLTERKLNSGERVDQLVTANVVHFVVDGQLELVGDGDRALAFWQHGDVVDLEVLPDQSDVNWHLRAVGAVTVVSLPRDRFIHHVDTNAKLGKMYRAMFSNRMSSTFRELNRTHGILANYADELWRDLPGTAEDTVAATVSVTPLSGEPLALVGVKSKSRKQHWSLVAAIAGTILGLGVALYQPGGAFQPAYITLGLLVAAAANWLAGIVPDYAVALGISVAAILLNLAKPPMALAGFISPTWFTLLAVWVIGVAVSKSGLLYRLALGMLKVFPASYSGQSIAMAVTGFITTPFLPSGQSRVVMVAPLVKELAEAMQFRRNSKGMAGLAMTCLISYGLMYFTFLNGSTLPLLAYSLLPPDIQSRITWTFWLKAALPFGLFVLAGSYVGIQRLLPPEPRPKLSRELIQMQVRILGRMGVSEWITAGVLVATLAGFAFAGVWKFEPAWVTMLGMLVVVSCGIVDRESLKRQVDWGFLLFFGAVLSFAGVSRQNGLDVKLSQWIIPSFKAFHGNAWAFVAGVGLITFLVRLVIPAVQSVPLLLIALTPVATAVGVNPFVVSLVVLAMGTNFVIPQQSPFYMALHAGTEESFTHRQISKVAIVHVCFIFIGMLATIPYWRWLGLLP